MAVLSWARVWVGEWVRGRGKGDENSSGFNSGGRLKLTQHMANFSRTSLLRTAIQKKKGQWFNRN